MLVNYCYAVEKIRMGMNNFTLQDKLFILIHMLSHIWTLFFPHVTDIAGNPTVYGVSYDDVTFTDDVALAPRCAVTIRRRIPVTYEECSRRPRVAAEGHILSWTPVQ